MNRLKLSKEEGGRCIKVKKARKATGIHYSL
jgi:hypothetical protein